jgi:hypothetical protein
VQLRELRREVVAVEDKQQRHSIDRFVMNVRRYSFGEQFARQNVTNKWQEL